jgi:superfamily II DNA/RNA helicase
MTDEMVVSLYKKFLLRISANNSNKYPASSANMETVRHYLLRFNNSRKAKQIIFCKTKAAVNKQNLAINRFHQEHCTEVCLRIRDRIMEQFREGHINILVATDLAARGIDVKNILWSSST